MIIGYDGSRAFSKIRTGTENYSYQLLKALAKIDQQNQYIVYLRSNSSVIARPQSSDYNWPKNFQFKTVNWLRLWTQGGLAMQTFKDKLDVLFIPAHTLPIFRKPSLKTVVTVHDLGSEYLPQMHQLKQRLYLSLMQKYQLKTATKIIAVSKATKEDLVKRVGIGPDKIKVVYEGYEKELFKPVKSDTLVNKQSLRTSDTEVLSLMPYFLSVGTVQPRKNLARLIEAFSLFVIRYSQKNDKRQTTNDLRLVIVGSKGWLSDEIYKLPKKLGIEDRVKFLGYVPDEKLPALYSGAEALVFPSLFEGFGLPILEAQACGCSVITSNLSSMPEVAGKGAILVDPYLVDDIVKSMVRIKNQELRIKLIKKGFENIKRFSWEKCARETLQVLQKI